VLAPLPLPLQKLWLSPGAESTGTGSPEAGAGAKAKAGADTASPAFPGPARRLMPILEEGAGENTAIMGGGSAGRKPLCGRAVGKEALVLALKRNLDYFRCLNVGREKDP